MAADDKKSDSNYDYTAPARLRRMRETAKKHGGGRLDILFEGDEMAHIMGMIARGEAKTRTAAVKLLVRRAMEQQPAADDDASSD